MSLRLFDFQCDKGHRFEEMTQPEVREVKCATCGRRAPRLMSAPRVSLEGISGDFPSAADKWVQRRESHMKKEKRNQERHGTYR